MALKTVDVPREFEPIFARAEEVVGNYFAGCSHDPSRAAIEIGGERYILVRAASLSTEFFALVRRLFEAGRQADADEFARNILFDLAHAIGKSDADNFHTKMDLNDPLARLSAGPVHFSHTGWAFVKIFPESNPSPDKDYYLTYDHPQSFEADAWLRSGQKSDAPVCVMNAGYSSGWCETSFGVPLVAVEILCRAKGDPCCRFVMAPPETIAEHVERTVKCQSDHVSQRAQSDIPEFFARKRLEDELRKSEEKLRRHNALLQGVNQVFEKALACESEKEVAAECLSVAEELTGSKFGFMGELNQAGLFDTMTTSNPGWGACKMPHTEATKSLKDMPLRGIALATVRDRTSQIVNDPDSHPDHIGVPEGHPPIVSFLGVPLKHGGKTIGMIGLANKNSGYDVSDQEVVEGLAAAFVQALMRKRAEQTLKQQQQFLETILDTVQAGIVACDADGVLTLFNRATREFHGLPEERIPAEQWAERYDLYLPDGKTQMRTEEIPLFRALQGEQIRNVEMMIVPKTGPARTLLVSGGPRTGKDGQKGGAVIAMHDITERRQAEVMLQRKEEELRQSQKLEAVGQLAGGIAHEFNNLLQTISGYTAFALEGLQPQQPRYEDLQEVRKAAGRAATLTRQLLGFSRRQTLDRKNVDLNEVVRDLAKMIRPVIGEHIELQLRLGANIGIVNGDPGEFQQALLNLCLNARDAMSSRGRLVIETDVLVVTESQNECHPVQEPGLYVLVSVTDTGCGMPPDVKERIFEPFYTTKEIGEGTGLGLAWVYGVVQQHGGTIHVDSELEKGSTFNIYLPTVGCAADTDAAGVCAPISRGTETVLLAEDEPMVRKLASRVLSRAGYKVLEASDGEQAVRLYRENRAEVELALLDLVMPKLDGHEVYQQISSDNPDLKVVFCTGYDPETSQSNNIEHAGLCLLEKPFEPDTLLHTVRAILAEEGQCQLTQASC